MVVAEEIILAADGNGGPVAISILFGLMNLVFRDVGLEPFWVFPFPVRVQIFGNFSGVNSQVEKSVLSKVIRFIGVGPERFLPSFLVFEMARVFISLKGTGNANLFKVIYTDRSICF